jgi:hypothetical protein
MCAKCAQGGRGGIAPIANGLNRPTIQYQIRLRSAAVLRLGVLRRIHRFQTHTRSCDEACAQCF